MGPYYGFFVQQSGIITQLKYTSFRHGFGELSSGLGGVARKSDIACLN